jgi:DNA-binding IclR family transcriptional regulator
VVNDFDDPSDDAAELKRDNSKNIVNSVLRACRILEQLADSGPELTLLQVAQANGLSRPTAHRLLGTLVEAGWVRQASPGHYALTMRVFAVGSAASHGLGLREIAQPVVRRLAQSTGDTAYLLVPNDGLALCAERIDGPHPVRVHRVNVGDSIPMLSGAASVAMVGFQPELLRTPLDRRTMREPAIAKKIAAVRRDGVVVSQDDFVPGVTAIGSPVLARDGSAVAGISVTGTNDRYLEQHLAQAMKLVRDAALELSLLLGYSGDLVYRSDSEHDD